MRITDIFKVLMPAAFLLVLSSCGNNDEGGDGPDCIPVGKISTKNTVLVYLGVDNKDFYTEGKEKIDILVNSWSDSYDGNMVVMADVSSRSGMSDDAVLVRIGNTETCGHGADTVKTYHNPDSSDPEFMKQVWEDVIELYPAERYGMVVLSHAMGWLPYDLYKSPESRALIEDNGSYMELEDFAGAVPRLEYLICDLCFMAGVEVAYELKDKVNYLVASPAEVLVPGFDYSRMMPRLLKTEFTEADIIQVAYDFYETFRDGKYYSNDLYKSATVSVVKNSELPALAETVRDLIDWDVLTAQGDTLVDQVQDFFPYRKFYHDLGDLIAHLYPDDEDIAGRFRQVLDQCVIAEYHTDHFYTASPYPGAGHAIDAFCGLTTYIPRTAYPSLNEYYTTLSWFDAVYR
ncbi:MAG: clostripain-related cysteine peptidase [Alistipes sp.]|nr:clostripain-related cysteine peptidase [Alistipes sp.]